MPFNLQGKSKKRSVVVADMPAPPNDNCCYVQLSRGKFTLVDHADFDWLDQWNWQAIPSGQTFYASRARRRGEARPSTVVLMHREIMDASNELEVDHINGDGLDNRRSNLRLVTRTENLRHRSTFRNSKSGFKGVQYNSANGKWRATLNLGTFDTAEEAARAYDRVIRRLFGSLAKTNFDDADES